MRRWTEIVHEMSLKGIRGAGGSAYIGYQVRRASYYCEHRASILMLCCLKHVCITLYWFLGCLFGVVYFLLFWLRSSLLQKLPTQCFGNDWIIDVRHDAMFFITCP